jgi:hypothetical protein
MLVPIIQPLLSGENEAERSTSCVYVALISSTELSVDEVPLPDVFFRVLGTNKLNEVERRLRTTTLYHSSGYVGVYILSHLLSGSGVFTTLNFVELIGVYILQGFLRTYGREYTAIPFFRVHRHRYTLTNSSGHVSVYTLVASSGHINTNIPIAFFWVC